MGQITLERIRHSCICHLCKRQLGSYVFPCVPCASYILVLQRYPKCEEKSLQIFSSFDKSKTIRNSLIQTGLNPMVPGCMTLCPGCPTATASKQPAAPETARPSWVENHTPTMGDTESKLLFLGVVMSIVFGTLKKCPRSRNSSFFYWFYAMCDVFGWSMLKVPIPININFARNKSVPGHHSSPGSLGKYSPGVGTKHLRFVAFPHFVILPTESCVDQNLYQSLGLLWHWTPGCSSPRARCAWMGPIPLRLAHHFSMVSNPVVEIWMPILKCSAKPNCCHAITSTLKVA